MFTREVNGIAQHGGVNQATVDRLSRLTEQVRYGARARARLANIDPSALLAGTAVWLERRRANLPSARDRAGTRWAGQQDEQIA